MVPISIKEILLATKGHLVCGSLECTVNSVFIDSRKISKGGLFVPIIGEKVDSHIFIPEVFKYGAVASFSEKGKKLLCNSGIIIEVNDTIEALQNLAKYYRRKFNIKIIGITGSVGKTTTKEMIAAILSKNLKVLKTQGNQNGQIGLPLSILNLTENIDVGVFEMGISEIGEMQKLCEIADPDFAIITNIGVSHIGNFKKIQITRNEKMKILKNINGVYFLNGDNFYLFNLENIPVQKCVYFGLNKEYPFKAENIYQDKNKIYFSLITKNIKEKIEIPCIGIHNVYNALAAIAVCFEFGLNLDCIKNGFLNYKPLQMRQEIIHIGDITLINDSYNSSPDSVKTGVDVLIGLNSIGRNIVVLADILELGKKSEEIHNDLGKYIGVQNVDVLISIGKKSKFLKIGATSVNANISAFHFENNEQATEKLKKMLQKGDKILIKGSRGMKTEEVVRKLINDAI